MPLPIRLVSRKKFAPGGKLPLLHMGSALAWVEWKTVPLFTKCTVSPSLTVMLAGVNLSSLMVTVCVLGVGVGVGSGVGSGVGVGVGAGVGLGFGVGVGVGAGVGVGVGDGEIPDDELVGLLNFESDLGDTLESVTSLLSLP